MKSHTSKMHCDFSVHFNDISETSKIKIKKSKDQNGTHHAVFAYNKFQVQLSGVTEY